MPADWEKTKRKGKKSPFRTFVDTLKNRARTKTEFMAERFYKSFNLSTKAYNDFYKNLDESTVGLDELNRMLEEVVTGDNITFRQYASTFKKWNEKYGSPNGELHPHHVEYSNVATQMRVLYEALLEMRQDMTEIWGNKNSRIEYGTDPVTEQRTPVYTGYDSLKVIEFGEKGGQKNITDTIEKFRELYITALAVSRETERTEKMTPGELNDVVEGFLKMEQSDWQVIKDKHINVMNTKDPMEIVIVPAGINKAMSYWEKRLGARAQNIIGDFENSWGHDVKDAIKNVDFTQLSGSKTISEEFGNQLGDILQGKKPKTYKKRTQKSFKTKGGRKVSKVKTSKSHALKSTLTAKGKNAIEQGNTDDAALMSKLKTQINRRLPAEVRRNMGAPALTNRSGTFSNSTQLLNIRRSPTGLTGDYTYMRTGGGTPPRSGQRGVYGTFENYGRWGNQYDPRDLIKTSIRKLAQEYTREKFVRLRRM